MANDIPSDFNPLGDYGFNEYDNREWNFVEREAEINRQFDQGLEYKSDFTLNLRRFHPK